MNAAPVPNIEYVSDVIPPVAVAKNISVELKGGTVTIAPEDVDGGSYDAFEIGSLQVNKTAFDCTNIGDNEVTLTVTDKNGNQATATAIVTVIGTIPTKPLVVVSRTDNTFTGADSKTIFLGYGAQQLTLTAAGSGAETITAYKWSPADGLNAADLAAPIFSPTTAGTYTKSVTVTNQFGCTAVSDAVVLNVVDVRCGDQSGKVIICHSKAVNHQSSKEICIDAASVQDHLAHGCRLGYCNSASTSTITQRVTETIPDDSHSIAGITLQVYPNPLSTRARISATLAKTGSYSLELHDVKGALVRVLSKGESKRMAVIQEFHTGGLAKGLYFIRLVTEKGIITKRILIQ